MFRRLMLAAGILVLPAFALSQSVTVHSEPGQGDYQTIEEALAAVQTDATGPDVITILDEGPFLEISWSITGDPNNNPLTIEAAPGVRPIVILQTTGFTAINVEKNGDLTIRDLIFLPWSEAPAPTSVPFRVFNIANALNGYNILLENILISSNDGNDQPVASLDGLTDPQLDPNNLGDVVSFRGNAIKVRSTETDQVYSLVLRDVIVSGMVNGATASGGFGIRGFMNGAPGSQWVIGEGCVISYNTNISGSMRGALQPGGNEGAVDIFRVEGTEEKPVKIINNTNYHGIHVTATNIEDSIKEFKWLVVANNTQQGFWSQDSDEIYSFENVTIANNGLEAVNLSPAYVAAHSAVDSIFAGNGSEDAENVLSILTSEEDDGSFTFTNSAVVMEGPYSFNSAMLDDTPDYLVFEDSITADPEFGSLDPSSADFINVNNEAYGAAGPGGEALRGAGEYTGPPPTSVSDWTLY